MYYCSECECFFDTPKYDETNEIEVCPYCDTIEPKFVDPDYILDRQKDSRM
jgi:uncharacterized paraquat-inducible protein A